MKDKIQTVFFYIITGVFVLGVIMIGGTLRAKAAPNYYILLVGCILLIPGIILILREVIASQTPPRDYATTLKKTGEKLTVNLPDCKIVSNNWRHERPEKSDKEILANELLGNSHDNKPTVDVAVSVIEYSCIMEGRKQTFTSAPMAKDKVTLMLLLEMQKETNIYIDRENRDRYYFDFEFLTTQ